MGLNLRAPARITRIIEIHALTQAVHPSSIDILNRVTENGSFMFPVSAR